MQVLHEVLKNTFRDALREVVGRLLVRKLKAQGIRLFPSELARIQNWLIDPESDSLPIPRWRWRDRQNLVLEFTDEDIREFKKISINLCHQIPKIIEDVSNDIVSRIFTTLKRQWPREQRRLKRKQNSFEHRLLHRWGSALGQLEMLLTISLEFGSSINEELRGISTPGPYKLDVLTRLHARSCQVVKEIIVLLRAGLADGAMARWRTLHEIATIALFIGKHGEDLAERYSLHEVIESRRAAYEYKAYHERLECEPMEPSEINELDCLYEGLLTRFGKSYANNYGWAAAQLGIDNPTFRDIEKAVGIDHLRPYYRIACHNVHANPKGVFFKLGLLGEEDILLAGCSNAGLSEPGQCAAISLVQASIPLGLLHPTLDNIIAMKIMLRLVDEICKAFHDAHQRLVHDSAQQVD